MNSTLTSLRIPTQECTCGKQAIYATMVDVWYCPCKKDLHIDQNTRQTLHLFWKNVNGLSKKKRRNNKKKGSDNAKINSSK